MKLNNSGHILPFKTSFLHTQVLNERWSLTKTWLANLLAHLLEAHQTHADRVDVKKLYTKSTQQMAEGIRRQTKDSVSTLAAWFEPRAWISTAHVNGTLADTMQCPGLPACFTSQLKVDSYLWPAQLLSMNILMLIKNASPLPCTYGFVGLLEAYVQASFEEVLAIPILGLTVWVYLLDILWTFFVILICVLKLAVIFW